jgi:gluconokinase
MTTPAVLILMGVSGSGKTRIGQQLAMELHWHFFDGDDFHSQENIDKMRAGIPLTNADREPWLIALQSLIRQLITTNQSAIIACSALKQDYRDRLDLDPRVKFVYLQGSYDLIMRRLQQRKGHYMPANLLKSQFEALEEPTDALIIDISQPPDDIIRSLKQQFSE